MVMSSFGSGFDVTRFDTRGSFNDNKGKLRVIAYDDEATTYRRNRA